MLFTGKSLAELSQLEREVQDLLRTSDNIDPEYWTRVLDHLKIEKLKSKLRTIQTSVQKASLNYLTSQDQTSTKTEVPVLAKEEEIDQESNEEDEQLPIEECPSPDPISDFEGMDVIPEDEDYDQIAILRQKVSIL